MTGFVHLRVHSAYSLSEGAIRPDRIAALAREDGMPAVAIADTANLFGALEFSKACLGAGVQPIIGCQLSLAHEARAADPIVVLARDAQGIANLQRLSSIGFLTSDPADPRIDLDTLASHAPGLFCLTGGTRGPLGRLLAEAREPEARTLAARLREAFPDSLAVELHRHGTERDAAIEPGLLALADALSLPLAATNECFFATEAMFEAHDALLCIAGGRTLVEADRRRVTPEHWFKPAAAMRALFADLPDACDNTVAIARLCAATVETRAPLLPRSTRLRPGCDEAETLAALAREGLVARIASGEAAAAEPDTYRQRLEYELGVVGRMGFAGYFLIVADFIQWAKSQRIPVGPGRGSGAGSVVAWSLTITDLDPLRFGLLFERFLNPERVSMPDFDIDFCQDRRDEVIAYVRRTYGEDRVAQIITFGKLQARAAVRDVGRVLQMPFGQVNRVAELIPNNPARPVTLAQAIEGEPRLREMRDTDEAVRRLLEIALQVEGLYRHASTHAAGVVIGDRPLVELVPLYRDPREGTLVTQYNMKWVELGGLVKFDFLGLTTLTILRRAEELLASLGTPVDLARIPLDDPATYAMLARGETGGVFQFEGQGMRDVLRQMRPDRLEDLVAAGALFRPGPMANIPAYCQRKHGAPWEAPHPSIRDILEETYGIMVYQEQVMQIAQRMAGFSLGAADLLRRAMGKKIRREMEAQRALFLAGCAERGIEPARAEEVFELIARFADYGFNKSHAAAYALVSYQTAWMRANHPVAFLAACMSAAISQTDKLAALRQEAIRAGVAVLPPSVNHSGADFTLERMESGTLAIRYGLAAVRRVGRAAMESLAACRGHRPFGSVADFAARIDPRLLNRAQLENLVRAGAFDGLEPNRARLFAATDTILRRAQSRAEETGSGQIGMFGAAEAAALRLPDTQDWQEMERLAFEAEAIGFHLTAHPLDAFAAVLQRLRAVPLAHLEARARAGAGQACLAGCVVNVKERTTRSGSRMAWLRLSDASGSAEVTLFSETLAASRDLLAEGTPVLVQVDLRLDGEAVRVTATALRSLQQVAAESAGELRVWLRRPDAVAPLRAILEREGAGRGRVTLLPMLGTAPEVEVALPGRYAVTPRLAQALKTIPGVEQVLQA